MGSGLGSGLGFELGLANRGGASERPRSCNGCLGLAAAAVVHRIDRPSLGGATAGAAAALPFFPAAGAAPAAAAAASAAHWFRWRKAGGPAPVRISQPLSW